MKISKIEMLVIGAIVALLLLALGGCKKTRDQWAAKGGIFTSSAEDYIVISQSGGRIMDVYKLRSAFVQSPENSDGWLFTDQQGNSIYIGGDVKTIRLRKDKTVWEDYHEYHIENENKTYRELYGNI